MSRRVVFRWFERSWLVRDLPGVTPMFIEVTPSGWPAGPYRRSPSVPTVLHRICGSARERPLFDDRII